MARAWKAITQNPNVCTEQKSALFWRKVFEQFRQFASDCAKNKFYAGGEERSTCVMMESISTVINKFKSTLREVRLFELSGTSNNRNLLVAIALHLSKQSATTYDAKSYRHTQWIHHLVFKQVQNLPKFKNKKDTQDYVLSQHSEQSQLHQFHEENVTGGDDKKDNYQQHQQSTGASTPSIDVFPSSSTLPYTELLSQPTIEASLRPPNTIQNRKAEDTSGGHLGRKNAKAEKKERRHNEIALRNRADIATVMKRWTELPDEHNVLQAFSIDEHLTEEGKKDKEKYKGLTRNAHLKQIRDSLDILTCPRVCSTSQIKAISIYSPVPVPSIPPT